MTNARPLTALCKQNGLTLTKLAERICRSRHTVKKWGREVPIPPEEVPNIVTAFEGAVQPHELRPDIFQLPPSGTSAHAAE